MNHCPSCDYPLPRDRERIGARCPNCRDPLYESRSRPSRPARQGDGACALHPGQEAAGTCERCGNYYCIVCRTRWRDRILCPACVERALESREAAPEQARAHARQAVLGLVLGISAWLLLVLTGLLISSVGAMQGNGAVLFLGLVALLLILGSMLLGTIGLGQAAAAVRSRGAHMIVAVSGLILNGLFVGALVGFCIFSMWLL